MFGNHGRIYSAANVKFSADAHEIGRDRAYDIVQNFIGDRLVKCALIAERPHVQLERFQFHTQFARHVFDVERSEIRLPGLRTEAGKLGNGEANSVIPVGLGIGKSLQVFTWFCRHIR